MTCLKCGRETDQTFCETCRAGMEKYPVKSGTIILLPKERSHFPVKRNPSRRASVPLEQQVQTQKKIIHRLSAMVASLLILLSAVGYTAYRYVQSNSARPVGQNYSTMTKPTVQSPETENETAPTESVSVRIPRGR